MSLAESAGVGPEEPEFRMPDDILYALTMTESREYDAAFEAVRLELHRLESLGAPDDPQRKSFHDRPLDHGLETGDHRALFYVIQHPRGQFHYLASNHVIRNWHDDGRRMVIREFIVSNDAARLTCSQSEITLGQRDQQWRFKPDTAFY